MKEIQFKEFVRSVKFIESLGCKFKIITPENGEYGDLEVAPKKKQRKPSGFVHGEISNFVRANLDMNAEVGSVQEIFVPEKYVPVNVQASACHILSGAWGRDTYTTILNKKTMSIEILRISKGE
jgi:hypothetical protein